LERLVRQWELPLAAQLCTPVYDLNKDCPLLNEVRKEEDILNSLIDSVKKATESVIYHYPQFPSNQSEFVIVSRFLKGADDATSNKLADGNIKNHLTSDILLAEETQKKTKEGEQRDKVKVTDNSTEEAVRREESRGGAEKETKAKVEKTEKEETKKREDEKRKKHGWNSSPADYQPTGESTSRDRSERDGRRRDYRNEASV
jgi:hypothetical protein